MEDDYKKERIPENAVKIIPKTAPFTISTLKKAIPPHCFERSLLKSFYYLFRSSLITVALFFFAYTLQKLPFGNFLYPFYWIAQGSACNIIQNTFLKKKSQLRKKKKFYSIFFSLKKKKLLIYSNHF